MAKGTNTKTPSSGPTPRSYRERAGSCSSNDNSQDEASAEAGEEGDDALAALKAHFVATFGQVTAPWTSILKAEATAGGDREQQQQQKEKKQNLLQKSIWDQGQDEDDDDDAHRSERDDQSAGLVDESQVFANLSGGRRSRGKGTRNGKASSTQPARPRCRIPETIVFDQRGGSGLTLTEDGDAAGRPLDPRRRWREFMKTHTPNTGPDSMTSASETLRAKVAERRQHEDAVQARRTGGQHGEDENEEEQLTRDRQLSHLLNKTLFAPGGNRSKGDCGRQGSKNGPDLSSHATLTRLLDLSSSFAARKGQTFGRGHGTKALRASQLAQMPAKMRQGIRSAAGHRADLEVQRRKEMGLLRDAPSRKLLGRQEADATMTGKAKAKRDRDRGLSMGVGKFQGGVLKLSRKEMGDLLGDDEGASGKGGKKRAFRGGGGGGHKKR